MRITIEGQFNEANDLLFCCVAKELLAVDHIDLFELCNLTTISGTETCATGCHSSRVPELDFVLIISCQKNAFFEV